MKVNYEYFPCHLFSYRFGGFTMYKDDIDTNSITCLKGIISGLNFDILDIAKESFSEEYIHPQLRDWGTSDFNYDSHVHSYLWEIFEKDKPTFERFLECLYMRIWKCFDCKKNSSVACKSRNYRGWDTCSDFLDKGIKKKLTKCINDLGYSINEEGIITDGLSNTFDPIKVIYDIQKASKSELINNVLPDDIIEKGKEMSEVYTLLYCIENSLRTFIDICFKDQFGDNYFNQVRLTKELETTIKRRKAEESKHLWLPIRGDNDLFYLDLIDLGTVMQMNWDTFKKHFSNQNWILVKIEDISKCRNFIAHNSYIENDEKMSLISDYKKIIKQISGTQS